MPSLERKHFIRKESSKRRQTNNERKKMLSEFLSTVCAASEIVPEVQCAGKLDPHEPLTRARGGSITDPGNLLWICRQHHSWLHAHPERAHEVGLLRHSWERA